MKPIQTLMPEAAANIGLPGQLAERRHATVDSAVVSIVNQTLKRLMAVKPAWVASLKDAKAVEIWKREWTTAFAEQGIDTVEKIERGMTNARADRLPWMPSAGQFVAWCKEGEIDDAEAIAAFTRMIDRKKPLSDPEYAARLSCEFHVRRLPRDSAIKTWTAELRRYAAMDARGEPIPRRGVKLLSCNTATSRNEYLDELHDKCSSPSHDLQIRLLGIRKRSKANADSSR
ncbi:MAG: replication protein P [Shewanella algae]